MPSSPLPPDKRADVEALAQDIREATDAEIEELARTLVATDDTHPFGATEFQIRDLAHKIAAILYAANSETSSNTWKLRVRREASLSLCLPPNALIVPSMAALKSANVGW